MSRKLSGGMQAAKARLQSVHQEIQGLQSGRAPVQYIPVRDITPSPFQARLDFTGLESLAEDIKANGILQPLIGRKVSGDRVELIAGERRWRAAKLAGLGEVPMMVREATDEQARLYGLRENLERQDLNAFEIASTVLSLIGLSLGLRPEEVRARLVRRTAPDPEVEVALLDALTVVGRDLTRQSFVNHYLPLLDLPAHLLDAIKEGASFNAVRLLRRVGAEQQAEWLPKIVSGEWAVRDVEAAIKASRQKVPKSKGESGPLLSESQRIFKLATAKRLNELPAAKQKKLQKLLAEMESLLQA